MTEPQKAFLKTFQITQPKKPNLEFDIANPVTVQVDPIETVVAMYYSIDSGPPCLVPGFPPPQGTTGQYDFSFTLTPEDCPDQGAWYSLVFTAWKDDASCDYTSTYFQYVQGAPLSPQRHVAAQNPPTEVKKPTFHLQLGSTTLTTWASGQPVPVCRVNTAQRHDGSTRFYCYWFRRDGNTIVETNALLKAPPKTELAPQSESFEFVPGNTGTYTLVVMGGAPMKNKARKVIGITHGSQSVSFKV